MTIDDLKKDGMIILECISGSKAYGLDTPESDTDIKGVFVLPKDVFYSLEYCPQVNNETNDIVYYELGRFIDLLAKNNPNILELLATPADCILHKDPILDFLKLEHFLSKLCKETFGGYAMTQIRKAKGLNKKIANPMPKERKGVLDFCYVCHGQGSVPILDFLKSKGLKQENCGLTRVPHMHEVFGIYYSETERYKGLVQSEKANDVSLSSIPKGVEPIGIMSFNKDGYSKYCKDYREYWSWVEKRNDIRYQNTIQHGKNYDAKNMMHTLRLLRMAKEIGEKGELRIRRYDRDFLLQVKRGEFMYEYLVEQAENLVASCEDIYASSSLQDSPDMDFVNQLLVEMREEYYQG